MTRLSAVCFDLDGTLCESEQDREQLLWDAFDDIGVEPFFGRDEVVRVDPGTLPPVETDREFFAGYFRESARLAGTEPDDETLRALVDAYLERLDPTAVTCRDGAAAAVEAAAERYPVALVTNSGETSGTTKLDRIGLRDAFDAAVFADPANGIDPKPDPTPLERALDALGVAADRSLLVGDTLGTDVAGAHAVGMHSAWVPNGPVEPDPDPAPTHVLESMHGVRELF